MKFLSPTKFTISDFSISERLRRMLGWWGSSGIVFCFAYAVVPGWPVIHALALGAMLAGGRWLRVAQCFHALVAVLLVFVLWLLLILTGPLSAVAAALTVWGGLKGQSFEPRGSAWWPLASAGVLWTVEGYLFVAILQCLLAVGVTSLLRHNCPPGGWPRLVVIGALLHLAFVLRFVEIYAMDANGLEVARVNRQPGVRVLKTAPGTPPVKDVRFIRESCDGRAYWVGSGKKPQLSRWDKATLRRTGAFEGELGKSAEAMFLDCAAGVLITADCSMGRVYVLQESNLRLLWQSPRQPVRLCYLTGDTVNRRVLVGQDSGGAYFLLDYNTLPQVTWHPLPWQGRDALALPGGGGFWVLRNGKLARLQGANLKTTASWPVPNKIPSPMAQTDNTVAVSDMLMGFIRFYDARRLKPLKAWQVLPGVRFLWMDAKRDLLAHGNYFSGWLSIRRLSSGHLTRRVFVGHRPRAMQASADGRQLLVPTAVGVVQVNLPP